MCGRGCLFPVPGCLHCLQCFPLWAFCPFFSSRLSVAASFHPPPTRPLYGLAEVIGLALVSWSLSCSRPAVSVCENCFCAEYLYSALFLKFFSCPPKSALFLEADFTTVRRARDFSFHSTLPFLFPPPSSPPLRAHETSRPL